MPCGGIARTLSLRSTRSHVAACGSRSSRLADLEVDRIVGRLRRAAVVAADAVLIQPGAMLRGSPAAGRRRRASRPALCALPARGGGVGRDCARAGVAARPRAVAACASSTAAPTQTRAALTSTFFIAPPASRPSLFIGLGLLRRPSSLLGGHRRRHRRRIVGPEPHQLAQRGDHVLARVALAAGRRAGRCCCPAAAAARASRRAAAASGCPCWPRRASRRRATSARMIATCRAVTA